MDYHRTLDEEMMDAALAEAREALAEGEVPIGAVVVCDGTVVARAHNRRETETDPTSHAELVAIRQASTVLGRWRLSDCTVYVTCEPCVMCAGAMHQARIGRLVYGVADPKAGAIESLYEIATDARLNHRFDVTRGVRAAECRTLLQEFFAGLRD